MKQSPDTISKILRYLIYTALMTMASCYTNKKMVYLQDKKFSSVPLIVQNRKPIYRVQPNDVLSVKVKSTTDTQVSEIFNISQGQSSFIMAPGGLFLDGYCVSDGGQITLPVIGSLTVKDMTLEEVQQAIQASAKKYLNNATVIVKLVSFKITVLGEVRNPGYLYVYNNQATVLEGLGLAGDLTRSGNRRNIKLIRQQASGSQVVLLDLTDSKLLQSEYFFLMPNDVLYVEPLRANIRRTNLELLSVLFSAATTAILILSYISQN